jgi:hypothetical protein
MVSVIAHRVFKRVKKANLAAHDATFERRSGRFWTIRINPKETALIAQTLRPCHLVIQNHGPGSIKSAAQHVF